MKILIVHTYYQLRGGEDAVFEQELDLLKNGTETRALFFRNKGGWIGLLQFFLSLWNIFAAYKMKRMIDDFCPDVIHIHNWHYASGPIIIRTAKKLGIPVTLTLHNYRLVCPSGSLMNKGQLFLDSISASFPWKAVRNKIFRDSYLQTFWLAFIVWFHKRIGTWQLVDKYIVLTNVAKDVFYSSQLNIPHDKFIVKSNFTSRLPIININRSQHFLYVGRLSEEKGTDLLLSVFRNNNYTLKIAGDGPLVEKVKQFSSEYKNISYLGNLSKEGVQNSMRECTALLFPSLWYETFGMVIIEAFALGCPVIASNVGSPTELVIHGINGLLFETGKQVSLQTSLDYWINLTSEEKLEYGNQSLAIYEQNYTPQANYKMLIGIYNSIV